MVLSMWLLMSAIGGFLGQDATVSNAEWKAWVESVAPLMAGQEEKTAKKLDAAAREEFRASFWRRRDPDPATLENEFRNEFEHRLRTADKRFRTHGNGAWNDCGRTFILLGTPDLVRDAVTARHFASADRLEAMQEQDDTLGEIWTYRNPPALAQSPQGYRFRFTRGCESLDGSSAQILLQRVAAWHAGQR